MITMADGSLKEVTTIMVGDHIQGMYGPERVLLVAPAYTGGRRYYHVNGLPGGVTEDHAYVDGNLMDTIEKRVLNRDGLVAELPAQASYTATMSVGDLVLYWDPVNQTAVPTVVTSINITQTPRDLKVFSVFSDGYGAIIANGVFTANYFNDWQKTQAMNVMARKSQGPIRSTVRSRWIQSLILGKLSFGLDAYLDAMERAASTEYLRLVALRTNVSAPTSDYLAAWATYVKEYRITVGASLSRPYSSDPGFGTNEYRGKYIEADVNNFQNMPVAEGLAWMEELKAGLGVWWETIRCTPSSQPTGLPTPTCF
eukprot:gb/GEZN01012036.1/.p1 GENE.gb/GEZN01012036.1/~~gb/GEZN01012036.1/.p1  ORF type:complete len:340 (-),score=30.35 gb/GEZN01012036.1/:93-1028(-)